MLTSLFPLRCVALGSALMTAVVTPATAVAASSAPDSKADAAETEAGDDSADDAAADAKSDDSAEAEPAAKGSISTKKRSSKSSSKSSSGGKGAPMKNRVGFGAMRTLSGLNGLFVRWYAAKRFTVGLDLGAATFSHRDTDENGDFDRVRTVGAVGVGPEFFFWPVQGDRSQQVHADFGVGLRLTTYVGFLGRLEEEQGDTLDIPLEIDIEIPAGIQLFIGKRVAIVPEFGVAFRIIPGDREPDQNGEADSNPGMGIGSKRGTTDGPGLGFELGDHAGLFMGIGFAYFFGKPRS